MDEDVRLVSKLIWNDVIWKLDTKNPLISDPFESSQLNHWVIIIEFDKQSRDEWKFPKITHI